MWKSWLIIKKFMNELYDKVVAKELKKEFEINRMVPAGELILCIDARILSEYQGVSL